MDNLETITRQIRQKIVQMHAAANSSHIGSCFSCLDIMAVLYFKVLKLFPENPRHPLRDRFILSKGHASSALYACLAWRGLIPKALLDQYAQEASPLIGHVDKSSLPFIEASTGSLGHGLPIGLGMAYALHLDASPARVFVLLSDGEMQEGTIWEAAHIAARAGLSNLTAIIDANKWQSYARTDEIMPIASFKAKWEAFGWAVAEVDGHDLPALERLLAGLPLDTRKPTAIIAHTVKGKGIKDFEDKLGWHYWAPKPDQVQRYLRELDEERIR